MSHIIPSMPPPIDSWRTYGVATRASAITAATVSRSDQGALLKNSHHTTTATPASRAPRTPAIAAVGKRAGTTKRSSHCKATRTTPGQSRSGLVPVDGSGCAVVIEDLLGLPPVREVRVGRRRGRGSRPMQPPAAVDGHCLPDPTWPGHVLFQGIGGPGLAARVRRS